MIIGLTGGIGSGKSATAKYFKDVGIDIIDADYVAKNVLIKNSAGYKLFIHKFGNKFLDKKNEIDRSLLRSEVFSKPDKKIELEKIIHPLVSEEILSFINNSRSPYCIVMVPLIFETNSSSNYDRVLVIDCNEEVQISRASLRDNQTVKEIKKIIANQASRKERLSIAHDVILNNSSLENLKKQVINKHNYYMELIKNAKMS
jgi:dephospho-CoA kinase